MIYRKINISMPNLYSKFHDSYIENFLQTNDNKNINKDRLFILNQNQITQPLVIQHDDLQLAAKFRLPKIFKPTCYIIPRYFENLRYIMALYDQFWNNSKVNFTQLTHGFATFKNISKNLDNTTNYVLNLNNFNHTKEARLMQDNQEPFFIQLKKCLREYILRDGKYQNYRFFAFFIVFEVIFFAIYFILWLPFSCQNNQKHLENEINVYDDSFESDLKKYQIYQIIYQRKYTGQ